MPVVRPPLGQAHPGASGMIGEGTPQVYDSKMGSKVLFPESYLADIFPLWVEAGELLELGRCEHPGAIRYLRAMIHRQDNLFRRRDR